MEQNNIKVKKERKYPISHIVILVVFMILVVVAVMVASIGWWASIDAMNNIDNRQYVSSFVAGGADQGGGYFVFDNLTNGYSFVNADGEGTYYPSVVVDYFTQDSAGNTQYFLLCGFVYIMFYGFLLAIYGVLYAFNRFVKKFIRDHEKPEQQLEKRLSEVEPQKKKAIPSFLVYVISMVFIGILTFPLYNIFFINAVLGYSLTGLLWVVVLLVILRRWFRNKVKKTANFNSDKEYDSERNT